ncbi:MAG: hypothetical protein HOP33_20170 [Verrucomicrobia bacterium]|nr:hypothetical protein [Verrucomicrobiota bacterium]
MTTKQEFIAKLRERDRISSRTALAFGILLVAAPLGMALIDFARTRGYLGWSGNVDVMKVFLVIWVIAFFVVFIGMLVVSVGRYGVYCPHCKKQLSAISAEITIATGFCGLCGEQVFEQSFKKAE